jgi:hypothetical protein
MFRNYYCAFISIQYLRGMNEVSWIPLLDRYNLMKDPHYEDDAQNWHCINLQTVTVSTLRIYYYQPSPNWINFGLKDISCSSPHTLIENTSELKSNEQLLNEMFRSAKLLRDYHEAYQSHAKDSLDPSSITAISTLSISHLQNESGK